MIANEGESCGPDQPYGCLDQPLPSNLCHMDLTVNYVFCISFSFYKVVTPDVPLDILTLMRMQ